MSLEPITAVARSPLEPFLQGADLFDSLAQPQQLGDPYPFYAWLRAHDPVHRDPDGTVYLSRYPDAALLKNPDLRDAPEAHDHSHTLHTLNQALIKAVPPRHTELRRVGAAAFDRRLLSRASVQIKEIAERLADDMADTLTSDGVADLHTRYSLPFAQRAAATVFGIPDEDYAMLASLPERMFGGLYPKTTPGAVADADDASRTLLSYMQVAVLHRRFTPGSGFARLADTDDRLPADDVVRLCWMLWWASYTSSFLRDNSKAWIEEALRFRSPHVINSANLTTRREVTVGATTLAPHTPVRFLVAAMNRDELAFADPDTFDPQRRGTPNHLAFGTGIHSCIGAQLARMEMTIALTTLATRLPRLALSSQPTWRAYTTQRLCSSFPVTSA